MKCCANCKDGNWMTVMSVAKCGHPTSRGGMKLCSDCAEKQDACEPCGEPLNPNPPSHTD